MARPLAALIASLLVSTFVLVSPPLERAVCAAELDKKGRADAKEAMRFYKEGNYEDAARLFLRLSINYPDMLVFVRNLGACYYYMRRYEPALSNLRDYVHRKTNITADDHAEVSGWIGELERLRDQAAAPPAAAATGTAPVREGTEVSAPAVPVAVPGVPVPGVPEGPPSAAAGAAPAPGAAPVGAPSASAPPTAAAASSVGSAAAPPMAPASPAVGPYPAQPGYPPPGTYAAPPQPGPYGAPAPAPPPGPYAAPPSTYGAPVGVHGGPAAPYGAPAPGSYGAPPSPGQYGAPAAGPYGAPPAYSPHGQYPPPGGAVPGHAPAPGWPPSGQAPAGVAVAQAAPPPSTGRGRKVGAWVLGIGGAAIAGVGGVLTYLSQDKFDKVEKKYNASDEKSGKNLAIGAGVCYGVGGAAIVTAIVLGLTGGSSSGHAALAPAVGPGVAGATLSGSF